MIYIDIYIYIYIYISFHSLINQSHVEIAHLHRLPYQMVTSKKISTSPAGQSETWSNVNTPKLKPDSQVSPKQNITHWKICHLTVVSYMTEWSGCSAFKIDITFNCFHVPTFKDDSTSTRGVTVSDSWHSQGQGHTFFLAAMKIDVWEFLLLILSNNSKISRKNTITILGIELLHHHLFVIGR